MRFTQEFVELDRSKHDLKKFDCGKESMNTFLSRYAANNMRLGVSRTWVLTVAEETAVNTKIKVAAYFSLTNEKVEKTDIPFNKSLPNYPLPVVLIARLAVDKTYQGQGIGEKTLITALRKAVELTTIGLPAIGIILDVLDNDALRFYQKFEIFEQFTNDPMRLFIPMHVAKQI